MTQLLAMLNKAFSQVSRPHCDARCLQLRLAALVLLEQVNTQYTLNYGPVTIRKVAVAVTQCLLESGYLLPPSISVQDPTLILALTHNPNS